MNALKSVLVLAAVAGFALAGLAGTAEARCVSCNVPIAKTNVKTVYKTKTVQRVHNVTRYKDVTKARYVKNVTRVVHRTVVQPVTRINTVTRVHNRTFVLSGTQHVSRTTTNPTRTIGGWSRTQVINHRPVAAKACGCG